MKIRSAPTPSQSRTLVVPRSLAEEAVERARRSRGRSVERAGRAEAREARLGGSVAPSRTAAIGGTRVARIAGRRLASSVTRMPTSERDDDRPRLEQEPLFGSVKPTASKSLKRPFASARPRDQADDRRERADRRAPRSRPTRSTCRREAPSVRSVANSRVRCAIVIESEFAITKLPTKSAMPPNASRKPRRKLMN